MVMEFWLMRCSHHQILCSLGGEGASGYQHCSSMYVSSIAFKRVWSLANKSEQSSDSAVPTVASQLVPAPVYSGRAFTTKFQTLTASQQYLYFMVGTYTCKTRHAPTQASASRVRTTVNGSNREQPRP
eukprot:1850453-Pleurochrysis_carterae.AAC.3